MIKIKNESAGAGWIVFGWVCLLAVCVNVRADGRSLLSQNPSGADFVLSSESGTAGIYVEETTDPAVARAARDLAEDVERVTDRKSTVTRDPATLSGDMVIVGVLGHSPLIDGLVAAGKVNASGTEGKWESYVLQVVESPFPNVRRALVIAGSDRRGAIYGLYEISEAIGVSPWYWWADVTPRKQKQLVLAADLRRFGPPSVKYRGIFINDEDWGLQPWAARTHEPENGSIGPKTYARVFELLLRLKANVLWPGMHPGTKAFNAFPQNKQIADAYAIVMGSSHAEPMLRNNVAEWTAPHEDYNYVTNREGVRAYWEQRVKENGTFENIYTLGMRGIHDSTMQGPKTDAERVRILEQIFADQRGILARHVSPQVDSVPQIFCAYKEVLGLYRQGLKVPDDVTIVWPDDNFGYVRDAASPEERKRSGGFGVYYHLSYLGRPLSYLWLSTTPPSLVWEEMHKAYEHGADRLWIANVGDIKPAEISTEFFLRMAWDINRWSAETQDNYLPEWAARNFDPAHAADIASLLAAYYTLNYQRKPEHLQWWIPPEAYRPSTLTAAEVQARLDAFRQLSARASDLRPRIPAAQQAAFYELVYYPVFGSALANTRFFEGERGHLDVARSADARLKEETRFFNEDLSGGKWRGIMSLEPADSSWSSMRIAPWTPPDFDGARLSVGNQPPAGTIARDAGHYERKVDRNGVGWKRVPGTGRTGNAVTIFPTTAPSLALEQASADAPRLEYDFDLNGAGEFQIFFYLVPTYPLTGTALRFAFSFDDAPLQMVSLEVRDGSPEWARGVLDAARLIAARSSVGTAGAHTLKIFMIDAGVLLDKIVIAPPAADATALGYLGPQENFR